MMNSRIQQFMESLNGKSVTFCGVGVSNTPVAELFARKGAHVTICDKRSREQLGAMGDRLAAAGAQFRLGPDYLAHLDGDMVFRTPGMKYTLPELTDARRRGIEGVAAGAPEGHLHHQDGESRRCRGYRAQ